MDINLPTDFQNDTSIMGGGRTVDAGWCNGVGAAANALAGAVAGHGADRGNPHGVTAAQAGVSNVNLLHNWDFSNPVNQRGLTLYTVTGGTIYAIDRWRISGAGIEVALHDGFIRIKVVEPMVLSRFFECLIEGSLIDALIGRQITASVKYRTAQNAIFFQFRPGSGASLGLLPAVSDWAVAHRVYTVADATYVNRFTLRIAETTPVGEYIDIAAVKLEVGGVSTLANDAPMDYGKELAVCQRYQHVFPFDFDVRACYVTTNTIIFWIPLPTSMRIYPQFIGVRTVYSMARAAQSGFTFTTHQVRPNAVLVIATKNGHGLPDAILSLNNGMILDANL
ncbi:MAG: hypothetical protein FWE62_02790 [Firmicutes bacterium]|nr:hypothetical protein [Bacillota bacterium]